MRAFLGRLTFDQLLALTVAGMAVLAGIIGGTITHWVYDQAGDA